MIYLGVDPGKSGAIAAIWDDGVPFVAHIKLKETEQDIAQFVGSFDQGHVRAVIERVSSSPQQGVVSAFTFGRSYGFLRGLLAAHQVPFTEVTPQKWQRAMGCLSGGDKNVTKARAQQLWPTLKLTHANSDAYLLAEYARKFFK